MNMFVIGSGGREHALAWKIRQSPKVTRIFCAPGNAGIAKIAACLPIPATNINELADAAQGLSIDLTVVGPEAPLVAGIIDEFAKRGLRIVGPTKAAAQVEGSKVFAKNFMRRHWIPTADYAVFFDDANDAREYVKGIGRIPCVIKADGLTAGKGVFSCFTQEEALDVIERILVKKELDEAGKRIVIEEFLEGEEATFQVFTDGFTAIPMPP